MNMKKPFRSVSEILMCKAQAVRRDTAAKRSPIKERRQGIDVMKPTLGQ